MLILDFLRSYFNDRSPAAPISQKEHWSKHKLSCKKQESVSEQESGQ
jgi:hypothetical protein